MASKDRTWELIQKKTFTKWANSHLRRRYSSAVEPIENIETQCEDGVYPMKLIHALYDRPIPKYNAKPKMKPHLLDNCETALKMIEEAGVKTHFLKPSHLVDHDLKMILGMVWAIILDYQIKGISVEELSAKEGLLLWCQKKTQGYKDVKVENFHMSFQDGLAFCALIHRHRPDLIDFDSLDKENKAHNLQLAFDVAEEKLGIPKLLDVEDIVDVARPDERSIMTYVSEYFHFFASQNQQEVAGRRIAKVLSLTRQVEQMKADFNSKADALVNWIKAKTVALEDRNWDNTLGGVHDNIAKFENYKKSEKPEKVQEKLQVETVFNNVSLKLRANKRAAFVPPEGFSLLDIDGLWQQLEAAETARGVALQEELARQIKLEALASRFHVKADGLQRYLNTKQSLLQSQEGETFTTVGSVQVRIQMLDALDAEVEGSKSRLTELEQLAQEITGDNYRLSADINNRVGQLQGAFSQLNQASGSRRSKLEAELARQQQQDTLRKEFAQQAKALERSLKDASETARDHTTFGDTLEDVENYRATLQATENDTLARVQQGQQSLQSVDSELKGLGVDESDYRFTNITVGSINARIENLKGLLAERAQAYEAELAKQQDMEAKRKEFAAVAQSFVDYLAQKRSAISSVDGEPEDQVNAVNAIHQEAEGEQKLAQILQLDGDNRAAGIVYNRHTHLSYPILASRWGAHKNFVKFTLEDLDQAIQLKQRSAEAQREAKHQQELEDLRIEFSKLVQKLSSFIQNATESVTEPINVNSVEAVAELQSAFQAVEQEYGSRQGEKAEVDNFNAKCAAAGITENPLAEATAEQLTNQWESLGQLLNQRREALAAETQRQTTNEQLRKEFASSAQALSEGVDEALARLQAVAEEAEIQDQLNALNAISFNGGDLDSIKALDSNLRAAGVSDNKYTNLTVEDLTVKVNSFTTALVDKRKLLEKELLSRQHSQVPPEQLNEIKECFAQFDKDNQGYLIKHQLKACLSALGESVSDEALEVVVSQYGDSEGRVHLDKFTEFMVGRLADSDNEAQIVNSFKVLSNDRPFVTEDQIRIAFAQDEENFRFLLANLPAHPEGGYDYAAFVKSCYQ